MELAVCNRRELPSYGNLCVRMFADLLYANHNARCTHWFTRVLTTSLTTPTYKMETWGSRLNG